MRLSFLHKLYPVISGIMAGQTPGELIAEARGAEVTARRASRWNSRI